MARSTISLHRYRFEVCGNLFAMKLRQFTICLCGVLMLLAGSIKAAESPFADAVEAKNSQTIHDLLGRGTSINAPQADGMTALHWAVYHDDSNLVKQLLAAHAYAKAANRY